MSNNKHSFLIVSLGVLISISLIAYSVYATSIGSTITTSGLTVSGNTTTTNLVITTNSQLGTVSSGTWQGTPIADNYVTSSLTISGGTINNTPIGLTTPSTGAFTTLGVTGTSTLATTTISGRLGVGTTSPAYTLDVNGDVRATTYYGDGSNLTGISAGQWSDAGSYIYANNATNTVITDSGKVGIGTTSPGAQLHIQQQNSADTMIYVKGAATIPDGRLISYQNSDGADLFYITGNGSVVARGASADFETDASGAFSFSGGWGELTSSGLSLAYSPTLSSGYGSTQGHLIYLADVADSTSTIAHEFKTSASLTTPGAKLLSIKNYDTEKAYIDKDGGAYFAGNVGIGTSTPQVEFHVVRTASSTIRIGDTSKTGCVELGGNNGTKLYYIYVDEATNNLVTTTTKPAICE